MDPSPYAGFYGDDRPDFNETDRSELPEIIQAAMAALGDAAQRDDAEVLAAVTTTRRRLGVDAIHRRCRGLTVERTQAALDRMADAGRLLRIRTRGGPLITYEFVR